MQSPRSPKQAISDSSVALLFFFETFKMQYCHQNSTQELAYIGKTLYGAKKSVHQGVQYSLPRGGRYTEIAGSTARERLSCCFLGGQLQIFLGGAKISNNKLKAASKVHACFLFRDAQVRMITAFSFPLPPFLPFHL